jgi:hypothetical protein
MNPDLPPYLFCLGLCNQCIKDDLSKIIYKGNSAGKLIVIFGVQYDNRCDFAILFVWIKDASKVEFSFLVKFLYLMLFSFNSCLRKTEKILLSEDWSFLNKNLGVKSSILVHIGYI